MGETTVTLYVAPKLRPEQNFIVENISDYLATITASIVFDPVQYIKDYGLTLSIKLSAGQNLWPRRKNSPNYTYAELLDIETNNVYYYYINKINWLSSGACELVMSMDTLNTYGLGVYYSLDARTKVIREHKDRYYNAVIGSTNHYYKKIDPYSEGINPVLFRTTGTLYGRFVTAKDYTNNTTLENLKWYLIYKTQYAGTSTAENPLKCFLACEKALPIETATSNVLNSSTLQTGEIYFFNGDDNNAVTVQNSSGTTFTLANNNALMVMLTEDLTLYYTLVTYDDTTGEYLRNTPNSGQLSTTTALTVTSGNLIGNYNDGELDGNNIKYNKYYWINFENSGAHSRFGSTLSTIAFSSFDKTDSKIMKIILLPYPPTRIYKDSSTNLYIYDSTVWEYDNNECLLKLKNLDTEFQNTLYISPQTLPFTELYESITYTAGATRTLRDPKLLHSDFYQNRLVYDSFEYVLKFEQLNTLYTKDSSAYADIVTNWRLIMDFKPTTTFNTRFLFAFTQLELCDYTAENYSHILNVDRNNEISIFSNNYIDYLRTGYNYDVKNKTRTAVMGTLGAAASVAGTIVSAPVTAGIAVINTAASITNAVNSIVAAEDSIRQKLATYQAQTSSVSGSDDVDLMLYYGKNKLLAFQYNASERMRNALNDLFYYTGYVADEIKTPSVNTRQWFNYLQADVILTPLKNVKDYYLDDIREKYSQGVTFFHRVTISGAYQWDLDQIKENYETWLVS